MRRLSKTANLLCSILCRRLVRTGMPAATSSSIMDDLCPAIVRSVTIRTLAPRRWAAIMAFAIFGLVMEYTAMSMVVARPSSAIMRSSHSVPGVKYASICAGALGGATVRVGNCAPTPTPTANAIAITKVHCLTNIQPQTKDHSNKSGREFISLHRNPVAFDKSYNNGIPTIVGTLKASLCKGDETRSRL